MSRAFLEPKGTHIDKARVLARIAHSGQVDKAGDDYFTGHLTRVAEAGDYYIDVSVGYLHDIVEDTVVTLEDLHSLGFSEDIIAAVRALTHNKDKHTYAEYITYIIGIGGSALRVKLNDVRDHLRDETMHAITASLVKRYENAFERLARAKIDHETRKGSLHGHNECSKV